MDRKIVEYMHEFHDKLNMIRECGRKWDPNFKIHKDSKLVTNYAQGMLDVSGFWDMRHVVLQHYIVQNLHDKTNYHNVMERDLKHITQYFKDNDDVHWVDNWRIVRQTCVPIYKLHFFLDHYIL